MSMDTDQRRRNRSAGRFGGLQEAEQGEEGKKRVAKEKSGRAENKGARPLRNHRNDNIGLCPGPKKRKAGCNSAYQT